MSTEIIKWLEAPEEHDFPAAESYLDLIYPNAKNIVNKLRHQGITQFKAKDIFRASQLNLLGVSNSHVEKNKKKIDHGKELSPLLLVRDKELGKVVIADGYHRMCAIYLYDEDAWIKCRIVDA